MMSAISSPTPIGSTGTGRPHAVAGAGGPLSSAFAMLFALMPGMGDGTATDMGEDLAEPGKEAARDGSKTDTDGKDLPSDAVAPPMPPVLPAIPPLPALPVEVPPAAESGTGSATGPVKAPITDTSAAPITSLLAAMPDLPAPVVPSPADASAAARTIIPVAVPAATPATVATSPVSPVSPGIPIVADATRPAASLAPAAAPQASPDLAIRPPQARAPISSAVRTDVPPAPVSAQTAQIAAQVLPVDRIPTPPPVAPVVDPRARSEVPTRFTVAAASPSVAAPLPVEAPPAPLQPGRTAPALQLFGLAMRGEQGGTDPRADRRKDESALSLDPATLARADASGTTPVMATTGAEQAPLDMNQHHWPQAMIERIDRMREDAATADTRIQLSPDALGGIAVKVSQEGGATHIHFTADQAQTASLLADAQPTLARLAEEKGMRLGQTAVDLGQSGAGGERQAPPRRPDPVIPARPAFPGATPSGDAADPAATTTRIA